MTELTLITGNSHGQSKSSGQNYVKSYTSVDKGETVNMNSYSESYPLNVKCFNWVLLTKRNWSFKQMMQCVLQMSVSLIPSSQDKWTEFTLILLNTVSSPSIGEKGLRTEDKFSPTRDYESDVWIIQTKMPSLSVLISVKRTLWFGTFPTEVLVLKRK